MVLHFPKYFHQIPCSWKHGSWSKNHVSKSIRRKVMSVGVGRHPKYTFWQPCCSNLATLMVLHFHKPFHQIPRPRKHRSRSKNHVSKSIRRKAMPKSIKKYIKFGGHFEKGLELIERAFFQWNHYYFFFLHLIWPLKPLVFKEFRKMYLHFDNPII